VAAGCSLITSQLCYLYLGYLFLQGLGLLTLTQIEGSAGRTSVDFLSADTTFVTTFHALSSLLCQYLAVRRRFEADLRPEFRSSALCLAGLCSHLKFSICLRTFDVMS